MWNRNNCNNAEDGNNYNNYYDDDAKIRVNYRNKKRGSEKEEEWFYSLGSTCTCLTNIRLRNMSKTNYINNNCKISIFFK